MLESDVMRKVFTPVPEYSEEERALFYSQMTWVGSILVRHGVPVIVDATANRRSLSVRGSSGFHLGFRKKGSRWGSSLGGRYLAAESKCTEAILIKALFFERSL